MPVSFSERMDALEALMVKVTNDANDLATFDELDAVVEEIFSIQEGHENRVTAITNLLDMVERTISTTNG